MTRRYRPEVVLAPRPVDRAARRPPVGAGAGAWSASTTAAVLGAWCALVVVARIGAVLLKGAGHVIRLNAAPLVGVDDVRVGLAALPPVLLAAASVAALPVVARRARWPVAVTVAVVTAAAFALALALVDGAQGVLYPLVRRGDEYLLDVPRVGDPLAFLASFTDDIGGYVTHVRSHPPGFLLVLWSLDRAGLGGRVPAAVLCIGGGAAAVAAVLVTVRDVAGPAAARAAAPFVAVSPAALWVATTADAFFAGVGAWAVALVVLATARRGRAGDALALAGGLLFGATLMLSYGLALLALLPVVVAGARRRVRPLVLAALGAAVVLAAFAAAGFWWLDGLAATRVEYARSVARTRPYLFFLVANAAAFALALGPATAVALARLRDGRLWLLVGAALGAVTLAAVSGMSKGEVERIWLPFGVWILAAGAALAARPGGAPAATTGEAVARTRPWLALQAASAVALQLVVRTHW